MKRLFLASTAALVGLLSTQSAHATTVTALLNVDNAYNISISTDDSVAGTSFGSGANWVATYSHSTSLTDGVTNYLHIRAVDQGGIAGMLASFSLSDTDFAFANGTQSLLSGEAGLQVSTSGWSGYGATTDLGHNGIGPWGTRSGNSAQARWVWSSDAHNDNLVYFSAAINYVAQDMSAVPVPASLPLIVGGLALLGGLSTRRKKG